MLEKETYRVNCPKRFVFGDPLYFEQERGERLKELTADIIVPESFISRVVLEEVKVAGLPKDIGRVMAVFLADEKNIKTFMQGRSYKNLKMKEKLIGVDSASYFLRVDDREDVLYTGGDGYWGSCVEYCWEVAGRKLIAGIVLRIVMPRDTDMKAMRAIVRRLFEGVRKVQNVEMPKAVREHEAAREFGQEQKRVDGSQDAMTMR